MESLPYPSTPDGWITVSLARLIFPDCCCACRGPATGAQAVRANVPFWRPGINWLASIQISVPLCESCQAASRHARRSASWRRTLWRVWAVGTLLAMIGGVVFSTEDGAFTPLLYVSISAALAGVGVWLAGRWADSGIPPPVQVRRYLPKQGTVQIRIRNHAYVVQMRQLMNRITTPAPVPPG